MPMAEEQLPGHIIALADRRHGEPAWKIEDVPALIAAAREAKLVNLGGTFQLRLPQLTHEYWYFNVDTRADEFAALPWLKQVNDSAQNALESFNDLLDETDLLETVRHDHGRTFWNRLFGRAYDDAVLRTSMYFVWVFRTEAETVLEIE